MEEVVALLARNLEAHETEAFSRDNGPLTFAADDYGFEFHSSPPPLALPNSTPHCVALSDPHETLSRQVRQGPAHAKSTSSWLSARAGPLWGETNPVFTDCCGRKSNQRCMARVPGDPRRWRPGNR